MCFDRYRKAMREKIERHTKISFAQIQNVKNVWFLSLWQEMKWAPRVYVTQNVCINNWMMKCMRVVQCTINQFFHWTRISRWALLLFSIPFRFIYSSKFKCFILYWQNNWDEFFWDETRRKYSSIWNDIHEVKICGFFAVVSKCRR